MDIAGSGGDRSSDQRVHEPHDRRSLYHLLQLCEGDFGFLLFVLRNLDVPNLDVFDRLTYDLGHVVPGAEAAEDRFHDVVLSGDHRFHVQSCGQMNLVDGGNIQRVGHGD